MISACVHHFDRFLLRNVESTQESQGCDVMIRETGIGVLYFLCVNPKVAVPLAKSCWWLKLAAQHRLCSKRSMIPSWGLSVMGNCFLERKPENRASLLCATSFGVIYSFPYVEKRIRCLEKIFPISLSVNPFSNRKTKMIWEERGSSSKVPSHEPSPGVGHVLSSACSAQDTPGLLRGPSLEIRWGFPGRREEMVTAAAPISFVLAVTTHCPESHGPPLPSPSLPFIGLPSSADRRRWMCTWKAIGVACGVWTASPVHLWTHSSCICLSCR